MAPISNVNRLAQANVKIPFLAMVDALTHDVGAWDSPEYPHTTDKLKLLAETAAILNADIVILQETRRAAAAGPFSSCAIVEPP